MSCPRGEINYKGVCVPSYFTLDEMESYYQEKMKAKKKAKVLPIILVAAVVVAGAIYALNFLA